MLHVKFYPHPKWRPNKEGTGTRCTQKMYGYLLKKNSPFRIHPDIRYAEHSYRGHYLKFTHPTQGEIFLFFPRDKLVAYFKDTKKRRGTIPHVNCTDFKNCFMTISRLIDNQKKNQRFIIPVFEQGFSGYGHVVTMVIDSMRKVIR